MEFNLKEDMDVLHIMKRNQLLQNYMDSALSETHIALMTNSRKNFLDRDGKILDKDYMHSIIVQLIIDNELKNCGIKSKNQSSIDTCFEF